MRTKAGLWHSSMSPLQFSNRDNRKRIRYAVTSIGGASGNSSLGWIAGGINK